MTALPSESSPAATVSSEVAANVPASPSAGMLQPPPADFEAVLTKLFCL